MLLLVGAAHGAIVPHAHREAKKGQVLMTLTPAQAASYAHWEQRTLDRRLLPEVKPIIPFGSSGGHGGGDDPNAARTIAPHLLPFGSSYHPGGGGSDDEQSFYSSGQQGRASDGAPPPPPACETWCDGTVRLNHHSAEDKGRSNFPTDDIADWAEKCSWSKKCGGCEPCNKASTVTCDDYCAVRRTYLIRARGPLPPPPPPPSPLRTPSRATALCLPCDIVLCLPCATTPFATTSPPHPSHTLTHT
mgnify:CR=1 FL=1